MIKILFETSVLKGGHAIRGIGSYARFLITELEKNKELKIFKTNFTKEKGKDNDKPDIIHYPFFDLFFDTLPINPFKNKVVTVHDVIPLVFPKYYKSGIKGKIRFEKQKLALQSASAVITDSESSKKDIIKHLKISEKKIHVIYLAANPDLKIPDEKVIKKVARKYKLPKKYLLYVGDINYNKNIPQLIKMMKFIDDSEIKLVCVGKNFTPQDIPEWQWIETQLALSNVTDRVIFLDNILSSSATELSAIYSGSLAYVQPSLYEGFGLPVLEAMQCKTPVICANNSSLIEVGGEHAIFVQPTAEAMAEAVNEVGSWSKTKRTKWISNAYKWSQTFSWQKVAAKTIDVYKSVLK